LAAGLKVSVGDIYMDEGAFANADSGSLGIPPATSVIGKYTTGVSVTNGVIEATLGNEASAVISTETVELSPIDNGGSISWTCTFSGEEKYAPKACR
jgi:type IV pilus assembly protein PilA